jgi:negative regulator of flagellin synthesis FlgM
MKISDFESLRAGQVGAVSKTSGITGNSTAPSQATGSVSTPAAQVELSAQAQVLASAKAAVDATPDTRDDLVARLKSQVDAGTYHVSSKDIADQILRRSQADQLR